MSIASRAAQLGQVAAAAVAHPRYLRHAPRLARSFGHSTLSLKQPWLPFAVVDMLATVVTPSSRIFEYGGGGSTAWFAERAGAVVTVEHDAGWSAELEKTLGAEPNVRLLTRSADDAYRDYIASIDEFPDEHFDVVVVDGRQRVRCFEHAVPKVKPGGLLLLDDAERDWYSRAFDLVPWPRTVINGFAPCKAQVGHTAVFTKPSR